MANEHLVTPTAYEKMKAELDHLKGHERRRVAEAIREAKSHGDLRENAAYHEAKLNQQRLDQRIAELEKRLMLAKVVQVDASDPSAQLGKTVAVEDLEWGDAMTITLVTSYEADPNQDLISITSPLGAAMIGRNVGDEVDVQTPAGLQRYRITEIR